MRKCHIALLILVVVLVDCSVLSATTYVSYENRRYVSPSGRIYVLAERTGGPVFDEPTGPIRLSVHSAMCDFAGLGALHAGVGVSNDGFSYMMSEDWKTLSRRVGDIMLGSMHFSAAPAKICISDRCAAICLVDWYGPNGILVSNQQACITVLSYRCNILFKKSLEEVFGGHATKFSETDSNLWWFQDAWVDEASGKLVIVGVLSALEEVEGPRLMGRRIDLVTGGVDDHIEGSIARALSAPRGPGFQGALEYVIDRPRSSYVDVLRELAPDESDDSAVAVLLRVALLRNELHTDISDIIESASAIEQELEHAVMNVHSSVPAMVDPQRVLSVVSRYVEVPE